MLEFVDSDLYVVQDKNNFINSLLPFTVELPTIFLTVIYLSRTPLTHRKITILI